MTSSFSNRYNLKEVTLPQGLLYIELYAFSRCEKIESIVIPDSVIKVEESAFEYSDMKKLTLSAGLKTIEENAFYSPEFLETLVIPEGVEVIENYAFSLCRALRELYLPKSLTKIGDCAFDFSKLERIVYAGTVEEWNSIELAEHWVSHHIVGEVVCSDGTVTIEFWPKR